MRRGGGCQQTRDEGPPKGTSNGHQLNRLNKFIRYVSRFSPLPPCVRIVQTHGHCIKRRRQRGMRERVGPRLRESRLPLAVEGGFTRPSAHSLPLISVIDTFFSGLRLRCPAKHDSAPKGGKCQAVCELEPIKYNRIILTFYSQYLSTLALQSTIIYSVFRQLVRKVL